MDEIIDHYQILNQELADSIDNTKQTLLPLEDDNPLISTTYSNSKKETGILKEKLKTRRDNKKANIPNLDDRIKQLQEGKQDNITRDRQQLPASHERSNNRRYQYEPVSYTYPASMYTHSEHNSMHPPPQLLMGKNWDAPTPRLNSWRDKQFFVEPTHYRSNYPTEQPSDYRHTTGWRQRYPRQPDWYMNHQTKKSQATDRINHHPHQ